MLALSAFDVIILLPVVHSFASLWRGYAIGMSTTQGRRTSAKDFVRGRRPNLSPKGGASILTGWVLPICWAYWFCLFLMRGPEAVIWGQHLHISNATYSLVFFLGLVSMLTQHGVHLASSLRYHSAGGDYAMSMAQLGLYLPLLPLSNTVLTLFFFLEASAILIFYNLVTTRGFSTLAKVGRASNGAGTDSKYFFNLLFFHFWTSFFSAALILYGIINLYLLFGTTEWSYLGFLISISMSTGSGQVAPALLVLSASLLAGFWIKMGLAPFFVYKVEVYNGLPLPTLIFYSIVYFTVFSAALFVFGGYYFGLGLAAARPILGVIVAASLFLAVSVYDSQSLRNFFALSSVLTATNLFMGLAA